MRTRTLTLKVPHWVPTRYQWLKWKKRVKLFFFPPRCHSCKCKLPVEYPVYYKYRKGYHLGYANSLSDFAINATKPLCRVCLKQYIHQLKLKKGTCDLCQTKNTKVIGYHFSKEAATIMFLWHWWNGKDFCLTCVDDLLDTGNTRNTY
jgi:hypothetical protein